MALAYGVDISRFQYSADGQVKMDFDKLKAHPNKPRFIGIRTGISWGYADAWFSRSWSEAKRIGIYRLPYHIIYFGESARAQADNFFKIIGSDVDWKHDKPVLDLEVSGGFSKAKITDTTGAVMEIVKQRTGMYPINYSRADWVNQFLDWKALPETNWWIASYLTAAPYPAFTNEKAQPPIMPTGMTKWMFHQSSSRSDGNAHGAASYYIDVNRFNGDDQALDEYFGVEIETPPTLEQRLADLEARVKRLEEINHLYLPSIQK